MDNAWCLYQYFQHSFQDSVCGSVVEHLVCLQKVPGPISSVFSYKDQVVGGMKESLIFWRAAAIQSRGN